MQTTFIPIDYDYFDYNGRNFAKVIGRDEKGKRVCIIDSCDVYLWAILKKDVSKKKIDNLIKKIEKIKLDVKGRQTKVEKVELHDKKFMGKKVQALKIYATNYKDLHDIADKLDFPEIEKRRGYDLGYSTHYIIEKKLKPLQWHKIEGELLNNSQEFGGIDMVLDVDFCIKVNNIQPLDNSSTGAGGRGSEALVGGANGFKSKILAYDIETDELQIGKGDILMISLVSDNFKKVITWKKSKTKQDYVEYVKDEAELIEKFIEYTKKISPDFLVGYFSDGFDLPYLKSRAEKNKVKLSLGLDESQPKFSRGAQLSGKIFGITHIDLLKFIRTAYAQYMKSETLSLNEVSKEFLGDTKKEFKLQHSSKVKEHEWKKYFEYNLHDSILTHQLFEKFWPDMQEFTRTIQEPIFDTTRYGLSKFTESYILHHLEKFNEIPEKRPSHSAISERRNTGGSQGAFVYEPTPGLYENIAMFDFTSMHTSIIISMNLSKSTLLEKKEKGCFESPKINDNGKKVKYYFSKQEGFFPALMKEIFEKRKKFKAEYKKNPNPITLARSNAFKVLSASAHGYVAFFGARYHSHEASSSILAFVRKFNQDTIEKVKKEGYNVIFGDTDSVAFTREGKPKKEVKEFLKKLNNELPGVMHLELEDFFKRGLWVTTRGGTTGAKKKYAMIDEEGKIKIRGFETVRRDWCKLAREVQNKIIKQILKDGNEKKALEYIKEIIQKIKNREIKKENLIIKSQLKKPLSEYLATTPHVIAARKMLEQKIPLSQGNLIEYYIAETQTKSKLVRDKVKLPEERGEYEIDYYLNRQILPAVENIFQVFDVKIKENIEGKKQTTLGDF